MTRYAQSGMAAAADTTAAWFTLAGALGGVLVTSAVALTTAVLNHRWQAQTTQRQIQHERDKQLRQERRETYAKYWNSWNRLMHLLGELQQRVEHQGAAAVPDDLYSQINTARGEWRDACDAVYLICSQEAVAPMEEHQRTTQARHAAAERGEHMIGRDAYMNLNDAMRKELL
ncbi:hypothetical protein ACOAKG_29255 [Streptomyces sp. JL3001]|uniref:hypothetical protein n=1 Tax=Streptomyces sp. JL3001 TaxID=3400923 RepID=UPI003B280C4A